MKCMEDWYERKSSCGEDGMRKPIKFIVLLHAGCKGNAKRYLVTCMAQKIHKLRADSRAARVLEVLGFNNIYLPDLGIRGRAA